MTVGSLATRACGVPGAMYSQYPGPRIEVLAVDGEAQPSAEYLHGRGGSA